MWTRQNFLKLNSDKTEVILIGTWQQLAKLQDFHAELSLTIGDTCVLLMEGRINGRRGRGRPRTMWTDNIKEWTTISYNDCIRVVQDRERWRSMTADLLTTHGT